MKPYPGGGTLTLNINNGNNTIIYFSAEKNEGYSHFALWHIILNHFAKRGFKVTKDPKIPKSIAAAYRCGIKNGMEFTADAFPVGFRFEFFQNVVTINKIGGRYDFNKYDLMPYLIKASYRLEMQRLAEYVTGIGVNVIIERRLTDIEEIIKSNNSNTHIHGKIQCLEDLIELTKDKTGRDYMDKNKKLIKCGETKYFYYRKHLMVGVVWHNINNMWWVIVNGKRYNLCSTEFFDWYEGIPKRQPLSHQDHIQRIHTELMRSVSEMNFERCMILKNKLITEKLYNVWSIKNQSWYGPNNSGYTNNISMAGVYTEETINGNPSYYNNNETTAAIRLNTLIKL